jgi:hypothetical protein
MVFPEAKPYGSTLRSRSPSCSSTSTFVMGTARQLRQIPSTFSSSLSTLSAIGRS